MVAVAVAVEKLHRALLDAHDLDIRAGAHAIFDHLAVLHVLELHAHERAPVAGCDVLELLDPMQRTVVADDDAGTQIRCRRHMFSP
jgi:hypothetical protein